MKLFQYLTIIFFLTSCGQGQFSKNQRMIAGAQVNSNDFLSKEELSIATRICYAFMSKRAYFLNSLTNKEFKFEIITNNKNCIAGHESNIVPFILKSSNNNLLSYESNSSQFVQKEETDLDGFLQNFCTPILQGDKDVKRSKKIDGVQLQDLFFYYDGMDYGLNVKVYEMDLNKKNYTLSYDEKLKILLDKRNELYGLVFYRIKEKICLNKLKEKIEQIFSP